MNIKSNRQNICFPYGHWNIWMEHLEHYLSEHYLTVPGITKINKQVIASHYENRT